MPNLTPVEGLGAGGLNTDTAAVLLKSNIISDGINVRFDDGIVRKMEGFQQSLNDLNTSTNGGVAASPTFGIHWPRPVTPYVVYANATDVYRMDASGNISEISNKTYASGARWGGFLFQGGDSLILFNGVDTPQYIQYGTTGATTETTLTDLPNFNYGSLTVVPKVVRPWKDRLIAMNLTINNGGVIQRAIGSYRVSSAAATGAIPDNWEPGVADELADEAELAQAGGIIDGRELRGKFIFYTENSFHSLSEANSVYTPTDFYGYGCLAQDCVTTIDGSQHFVVGTNDIYTHSGTGTINSIATGIVRNYFFNNLSSEHMDNTFVLRNGKFNEVWVCFPNSSSTGPCNEALIYNWRYKTWTRATLPNIRSGFEGPTPSSGNFDFSDRRLFTVSPTSSKLYAMDMGFSHDGQAYQSYIERKRTDFGSEVDFDSIQHFYPIFDAGTTSTNITISLAGQNSFTEDVTFDNTRGKYVGTFNPSKDRRVESNISGRLQNWRLESNDTEQWELAKIIVATSTNYKSGRA